MRFLFAAILLLGFVPSTILAGDDDPYKDAKVGDWVEYNYTGKDWRAPAWEGKIKMTVIARDDKELTYEVAAAYWLAGKKPTITPETPAVVEKIKIDLTKPHDVITHAALHKLVKSANVKEKDVKAEKLGEGKEKIKVSGKEYDTRWTRMKYTARSTDPNWGGQYVIVAEMWVCSDVPLSGQVILEINDGSTTRMELTGFGRK